MKQLNLMILFLLLLSATIQAKCEEQIQKQLAQIPKDKIEHITLEKCDLYRSDFSALKNLKSLTLKWVTRYPKEKITGLLNIQKLSIEGRFLHEIEIKKLVHLKELTLFNIYNMKSGSHMKRTEKEMIQLFKQFNIEQCYSNDLFINLYTLNHDHYQTNAFSFLTKLTKLERLTISRMQLSNLSPLKTLKNLHSLNLDRMIYLKDISDLKYLKQLKKLTLSNNSIKDYSPLKNLINLEELNLSRCNLKDFTLRDYKTPGDLLKINFTGKLEPLRGLKSLKVLNVSGTQVRDFSAVSHVPKVIKNEVIQDNSWFINFLMTLIFPTIFLILIILIISMMIIKRVRRKF